MVVLLAEVFDERAVAAGGVRCEALHFFKQRICGGDDCLGAIGFLGGHGDQSFPSYDIGLGIEEDTFGFEAVATCAAGFLLVMFD